MNNESTSVAVYYALNLLLEVLWYVPLGEGVVALVVVAKYCVENWDAQISR